MRLIPLVAALAILAFSSPASGDGLVLDEVSLSALADLFEKGGLGHRDEERGAFLMDGAEGPSCVLWPFTTTKRSATFRGRIPAGAVALAHTHPNGRPDPSIGDRRIASSLGMPVFVVTARGIRAAVPGSDRPVILLEERGWARRAPGAVRCGAP